MIYKLISGLHSSISAHIAADYLLDEYTNQWAVTKAAEFSEQAEYNTGNHAEDLKTQSLIHRLLYNQKLKSACPLPFDEAKLWQGQNGPELKQQIQKQFQRLRSLGALLDRVGCEKCHLWGKLQVLGLGTALKILFSVNGKNQPDHALHLQRNEVIALVNLLNRLSESIKIVKEMGPLAENITVKQNSKPTKQLLPS